MVTLFDHNGNPLARSGSGSSRPSRSENVIYTSTTPYYSSSGTGYRSSSLTIDASSKARGGSGAYHQQASLGILQDQTRWFMRNNGIFSGMLNAAADYIWGNGFTLQFTSKSKSYNTKAEKLFNKWWEKPEIKQQLTGRTVGRMGAMELLAMGEWATILTDQGLLDFVESEQIKSPRDKRRKATSGMRFRSDGSISKYFACPYDVNGQADTSNPIEYDADFFLFAFRPDRFSSLRAVPTCQAVYPSLHRVNDVCDSEAIAWQLLSRIAISIIRKNGPKLGYDESEQDTSRSGDDFDDDTDRRITELGNALIFHGESGDKIDGVNRNIPGKDFTASLTMFLRMLGQPLGLPLEVILNDWTKSNFSQCKAALVQAFQRFLGWQFLIEDSTLRPIVDWKIKNFVAQGLLPDRKDGTSHEWLKPKFPWLEQLKEALSFGVMIDRGFTSHSRVLKTLNLDRDEIVIEIQQEMEDAINRKKTMEEKFKKEGYDLAENGIEIPWESFMGHKPSATKGRPAGAAPASSQNTVTEPEKGSKK